jgi:hypothetical protein
MVIPFYPVAPWLGLHAGKARVPPRDSLTVVQQAKTINTSAAIKQSASAVPRQRASAPKYAAQSSSKCVWIRAGSFMMAARFVGHFVASFAFGM